MKTTLFIIMFMITSVAIAQDSQDNKEDKKGMSRVQKLRGVEIYVMSEPLREYIVVDKVSNQFTAATGLTVPLIVSNYLNKAEKKRDKDGLKFDALIINDDSGVMVKWKD